jgi:uncharacterized membrane protein YcaP (DUF421 family)
MFEGWVGTSLEVIGLVVLSVTVMYLAVLLLARIGGLRSFAEMSAFDFAMTVALGTIIASTAVAPTPSLLEGLIALATIFAVRFVIAYLRIGPSGSKLIDNEPLLLMDGDEVLEENLREAKMTRDDLIASLRTANVSGFDDVLAVVLETTGKVSVIHSGTRGQLDPGLLEGVRRS